MPRFRRRGRLLLVPLLLAVGSSLAGVAPRAQVASADSFADPSVTVTASATSNLTDGQVISVDVKPAAGVTVTTFALSLKVCTDDVTQANASSEDHCAYFPYSAATDGNYGALFGRPDGSEAFGKIQIGVGTATHTKFVGTPQEVTYNATCDPDHPCRLVVSGVILTTTGLKSVFDTSTQLTFRTASKISGCDGFSPDAVSLALPDRLANLWAGWTVAQCQTSASHLAPTRSAFVDEGSAVTGFASGDGDAALAATGYRSPGFEPGAKRPYVATPLALNAVVLAVGGGYVPSPSDNWPNDPSNPLPVPFTDVKLTQAEMAALVGWNNQQTAPAYDAQLKAENPQLALAPTLTWPALGSKTMASATTDATTLFATTFLNAEAPDVWKIPSEGPYDSPPGTPRGVTASFATAPVSFNNVLSTFTGKPALQKQVYAFSKLSPTERYGVYWVLTDLATAKEMGLTPVALRNAAGKYVTPSDASLAAAVPTMTKQSDGTLLPNPTATSSPDAYPLTFVEYALTPAEPLVDSAGKPRPATEAALTSWLSAATTSGQSSMASGFTPLTPGLQEEATASIAKIGKGVVVPTKPPTEKPSKAPASPTVPSSPVPDQGGSVPLDLPTSAGLVESGSALGDASSGLASRTGASVRASTVKDVSAAKRSAAEASIELPPFLGIRATNLLAPLLSLLLLVLLLAAAAVATAGRELPEPVDKIVAP